jgi:hypothetical protein
MVLAIIIHSSVCGPAHFISLLLLLLLLFSWLSHFALCSAILKP